MPADSLGSAEGDGMTTERIIGLAAILFAIVAMTHIGCEGTCIFDASHELDPINLTADDFNG